MKDLHVWVGMWLNILALRHGVLIAGAPGTGKSLLLKAFRMSLARLMREYTQLIIKVLDFDTKADLYAIHRAFPKDVAMFDLSVYQMADIFDVMGELDDPRDIKELLSVLVDVSSNDTQKFFPHTARSLGRRLATRHWLVSKAVATLRDLVLTCTDPPNMRNVARSHSTTRGLLPFLQNNEAGMGIMATLATELDKLSIPAALYATNPTGRKVSTKTVTAAPRCVVRLPFDMKGRESTAPLTRLFVTLAMNRVLGLLERDALYPVILDELALLPGGIDLSVGSVFGRECGWAPLYALQSFITTYKTFGKENLEAAISNAKTFICFNLSDPQDAEIAAKRFKSFEGLTRETGGSSTGGSGGGSSTFSWTDRLQPIQNVTPGMIMDLNVPGPRGSPSHFIEYYIVTVGGAPAKGKIDIADLAATFFEELEPVAPPAPRAAADMILQPWDESDYRRLKLPLPRRTP